MSIPERQCDTWSNPGATTTAVATHEAVRRALDSDDSPLRGHRYEVFLQGSYKNDTNVRGDSDVDIVVQLNETFWGDRSSLDDAAKARWTQAYPTNSDYQWSDFDRDVTSAVRLAFGQGAVHPQDKCILIDGGNGRLNADVVVAISLRDYTDFAVKPGEFVQGIAIWPRLRANGWIQNYPKRHYDNGVTKNGQTEGCYKPSVRMFKNARNCAIDRGLLADNVAPSYFVECLLWNVPLQHFQGASNEVFAAVVRWLLGADRSRFVCQNGRVWLFGTSAQQWTDAKAAAFINALADLWNNWT